MIIVIIDIIVIIVIIVGSLRSPASKLSPFVA